MKISHPSLGLSAAVLLICVPAMPAAAQPEVQLTPLAADVLSAPQPVLVADGSRHLVYELRVENVTDGRFTFNQMTVLDQQGATLAQLDAQVIGTRFSLGARRGSETDVLGGSQFGVAFLDVTIPAGAAMPTSLTHIVAGYSERAGADFSMHIAKTPVVNAEPAVLAAPLRGRGYVVGDGCCDTIRHVRALLTLDGRFYLAQRFAIDWEKIDDAARVFTGDAKVVQNYRIYDQPIFAVADGLVVAARNDLDDQIPGALPPGLPIDQADGNFAIIKLREGVYALYAHMRRGTVSVSAGVRVHQGEQIGNVGNSGNTQAPHLHFQLMDGPSALAANGLPYVFDSYTVTAVDLAGTADFDRAEATGTPMTLTPETPPIEGRRSLPLDLSIVTWTK